MSDRVIADIASAVADRDAVDWHTLRARLGSTDAGRVASQLETLSRITGVSLPAAESQRPDRRLPIVLEAGRLTAIVCVAAGAWAHLRALAEGEPRAPVLMLIMAAFAAVAVVLDAAGDDRRARALGACYWVVAASFGVAASARLAAQAGHGPWWTALGALRPEALFPAFLWQFARDFPMVTHFSRLDRACAGALLVSTVVGVVAVATNLAPAFVPVDTLPAWLAALDRFGGEAFWVVILALALPALGAIALRARRASGREARRVRLFLLTFVAVFGLVAAEVVAEAIIPAFGQVMRTPAGRLWGGVVIYGTQLALPVLTAYAVLAGDVLGFRVVLQRALRYLLARAVIAWGAVVPLVLLGGHVYLHREEPLSAALSSGRAQMLVWASAAALALLACRARLLAALDAWALPGAESPAAMLASMSERMKHARTPLEVAALLASAAERAIQAPAAALVMKDGRLVPVQRTGHLPPGASMVPLLLEGAREPCIVAARHGHSYYGLMLEQDRSWVQRENIAVLVPVISGRTSRSLVAVIALQHRRNAMTFSPDDLRFLSAASAAAGLACDVLSVERTEPHDPPALAEEVAFQCGGCGRVETWRPSDDRCDCGGTWEPAAVPKTLARRFEVTRVLGAGGMGVVYRATDPTLGREVAVKTLTRLTDDAADRLIREARTMAALSHGNIAVLYGAETWRGTPLLIMEYLSGGTLAARLRRGPMPARESIEMAVRLLAALERVHRAGMIHGDIKPSNIGFAADGTPKFLDFGLSRVISGATPRPTVEGGRSFVAGTPAYMSPDVRDGALPGPALDVWALSLVLWESISGSHPLVTFRNGYELADAVAAAAPAIRAAAGDRLCDALVTALAPRPEDRPQDVRQLLALLGASTQEHAFDLRSSRSATEEET